MGLAHTVVFVWTICFWCECTSALAFYQYTNNQCYYENHKDACYFLCDSFCLNMTIAHGYCFPSCDHVTVLHPGGVTSCQDDCEKYSLHVNATVCIDGDTCPDGTFSDPTNSRHCELCMSGCLDCEEPNVCLKCQNLKQISTCTDSCDPGYVEYDQECLEQCPINKVVFQNKCYNQCPENTFLHFNRTSCGPCDAFCNGCTGPDSNQCKQCNTFLARDRCVAECPEDLPYNLNKTCVSSCPVILFNNTCISSCPSGAFEFNQECVNICPAQAPYYDNNHCVDQCPHMKMGNICVDDCRWDMVSFNSTCLEECPKDHPIADPDSRFCDKICHKIWYHDECLTSCPAGMFSYNETCVFCHRECNPSNRCYNSSAQGCESCRNYHSSQQGCVAVCPSEEPLTVNGQTDCFSHCPDQNPLLIAPEERCADQCPDATVIYNSTCIKSCPTNAPILHNKMCVSECSAKYFLFNESTCVSDCPEYSYEQNCVSICPADALYLNENKCVRSCNGSDCHYPNSTECSGCTDCLNVDYKGDSICIENICNKRILNFKSENSYKYDGRYIEPYVDTEVCKTSDLFCYCYGIDMLIYDVLMVCIILIYLIVVLVMITRRPKAPGREKFLQILLRTPQIEVTIDDIIESYDVPLLNA